MKRWREREEGERRSWEVEEVIQIAYARKLRMEGRETLRWRVFDESKEAPFRRLCLRLDRPLELASICPSSSELGEARVI